jgi:hypothetical protein
VPQCAGWIEQQVALIDNNFMMLIQAEVDKFHAAIGLLIDYYAAQNLDSNTEILLVSSEHTSCASCARVRTITVCRSCKIVLQVVP